MRHRIHTYSNDLSKKFLITNTTISTNTIAIKNKTTKDRTWTPTKNNSFDTKW